MALGAPNDLLSEAQRAALDEIRHADTCWAFARGLGLDVQAGTFPFGESGRFDVTLEELAAASVRDGCIAETVGALLLAAAARATPDADVRRAFSTMAEEEARHALFSYRVVAWAVASGGASVRAAIREAVLCAPITPDLPELALRAGVDSAVLREALDRGVRDILQPARAALLAA